MRIILTDPKVNAILVNIFGGITRGDEVARGLIEARAAAGARRADGRPDRRARTPPRPRRCSRRRSFATAAIARRGGRQGRRGIAGSGGMSILVGRETRLVVQGITGREGEFHSRAMQAYGTPIVAGVTPGKGGQTALDGTVPVFDTVADAVRETGANTSCIFVPAGRRAGRRHGGRRGRASRRSSASPRASRRST